MPIRYGSNLRVAPNVDYDRLFPALKRGGFDFINIGLESGSERVRREVLRRNYSNQDLVNAVSAARRHGLKVGTYNLIGIPGETRRDFLDTVRVNRACRPDWFLLSVFFPYPGTRLHDTAREQGLLDGELDNSLERRRPVLDLPGFGKREIRTWFILSPLLFNAGYKPLKDILNNMFRSMVFSNPSWLDLWRKLQKKFSLKRSAI